MAGLIRKILNVCLVVAVVPCIAFGGQARNARGVTAKALTRGQSVDNNAKQRRSAMSVIARSASANTRRARTVVTARPGLVSRSASGVSVRSGNNVINNKTNVSRAATVKTENVRSGANKNSTLISNTNRSARSATTARLTEIFNDLSKIGGSYASCRDAYSTCMDQFCFNANDAFRRCFCSEKFKNYKKISDNLDNVIIQLSDFANTELQMIDKSADEVDAMLSATEGENAIREDTSELQKKLDSIANLLYDDAGLGTVGDTKNTSSSVSLDLINFGDFADLGDIWSGSASSIFDRRQKGDDLSNLEGDELYTRAANQCTAVTRDSCQEKALFDMTYSAYSILMAQDCHEVERAIDTKRQALQVKIREAEKVLRNKRLEDYRTHNSKDVNECIGKVEAEFTDDSVCGANYEKCLDRTHEYIDASGNVILSKHLFQITKVKPKLGTEDIIKANPEWDAFLEARKHYAEQALDGCRSIAPIVWEDFKTNTLFRIAQGQDDKLEETKNSCAATIKDCYKDRESNYKSLATIDDDSETTTYSASALGIVAARGECYDKVMACASLYGDPNGCVYNKQRDTISPAKGQVCGLQSLLTFVDTVDATKVAMECESALTAYAKDYCGDGECMTDMNGQIVYTGSSSSSSCVRLVYPQACALKSRSELRGALLQQADLVCAKDFIEKDSANTIHDDKLPSVFSVDAVNRVLKDIFDKIGLAFTVGCEEMNGEWWDTSMLGGAMLTSLTVDDLHKEFYDTYYGGTSLASVLGSIKAGDVGVCMEVSFDKICTYMQGAQLEGTTVVNTTKPKTLPFEECVFDMSTRCEWLDMKPDGKSACK